MLFAKAYRALGLAPDIKKTQVLYQPPTNQPLIQPTIKVDSTTMENVDHFPDICSLPEIDLVVNQRMSCSSVAYARFRERLFQDRDLKAQTKLLVYHAVVLPPALQN